MQGIGLSIWNQRSVHTVEVEVEPTGSWTEAKPQKMGSAGATSRASAPRSHGMEKQRRKGYAWAVSSLMEPMWTGDPESSVPSTALKAIVGLKKSVQRNPPTLRQMSFPAEVALCWA